MLRVATFNVNGIRAALRRGVGDWFTTRGCDAITLQEVRCQVKDLPDDAFGRYHAVYESGLLAGRNGVAILTREPVVAIRSWGAAVVSVSPGREAEPMATHDSPRLTRQLRTFASEGRYLEVDLADRPVTLACLYLPKGDSPYANGPGYDAAAALARYERKMVFMAGLTKHVAESRKTAQRAGREFLITGDFNIAHTNLDLRNWRTNHRTAGFLPEEREWLDQLIRPRTLVDVVRRLHPDQDGPYSWWSWRGQAFAKDVGWRIDYHLATPKLAKLAVSSTTDRDASYETRMSDHCPVVVDYDI